MLGAMPPDTLYVRRIGSLTVTTVSPGCEATRISPSWRSTTIRREVSSPRPVPLPTSFVVKNGSNARACTSGAHRDADCPNGAEGGQVGYHADRVELRGVAEPEQDERDVHGTQTGDGPSQRARRCDRVSEEQDHER